VDVERLVVRDRQHPCAQVRSRPQPLVRAQRRQERLLEGIVGVVAPDGRDEEAQHIVAVGVEEALEGRQAAHADQTRGAGGS
jgi:hypothetical protein